MGREGTIQSATQSSVILLEGLDATYYEALLVCSERNIQERARQSSSKTTARYYFLPPGTEYVSNRAVANSCVWGEKLHANI